MEKKTKQHKHKRNVFIMVIVIVLLLMIGYLLIVLKSQTESLTQRDKPPVAQLAVESTTQPTLSKPTKTPAPTTPITVGSVLTISSNDWVRGNRNASLAMIVYSDYECNYCKAFHPTTKQVVEAYKDRLMLVYRHYPMSLHANAQKEAEAAECAGEIGGNDAFWTYTDTIFERTTSNGTGFSRDALVPLAKEIGLDETEFTECLDSGSMTEIVTDEARGGEKVGVTGTPATIILNIKTGKNNMVPGSVSFDQLKTVIDGMLQ